MNQSPLPATSLTDMAKGYFRGKVLCAAVRLRIPDALAHGERSLSELAAETSTQPDHLFRLLRALAGIGVIVESDQARFSLTPLGEPLRTDVPDSVWASIVFWADLLADQWTHLADCVSSGESAAVVMEQRGVRSRWSMNADAVSIFHAVFAESTSQSMSPFVTAHDFSRYRSVADLGGGGGGLLCAILKANPELRGVLVDRQEAIENAARKIQKQGLTDRCETMVGDLLEVVPAGADAYILQSVLHGYDDQKAGQILDNCRRATQEHTLLIIEVVLPRRIDRASPTLEQMLMSDINMLAVTGGRERSESEWSELLSSCGYEIRRITPVPDQLASILECVPAQ